MNKARKAVNQCTPGLLCLLLLTKTLAQNNLKALAEVRIHSPHTIYVGFMSFKGLNALS